MSCIAQKLQAPIPVTVPASTTCCNNLITAVSDITIDMKNINAFILRGKVICGSGPANVENAIVVAKDASGNYYVGITNSNGEYSICVPGPGAYNVEAYKCCCGTSITNANCDCTV